MRLESRSEADTERWGESLAKLLQPGDVIALEGPLGAGKTRFVAGLARGIEAKSRVRSPTFTLVHEYPGRIPLIHADLYRLERDDVAGLGLEEALERGALVVEWAERLPSWLADRALRVVIRQEQGDRRTFEISAGGGRAGKLLERWRSETVPAGDPT